MSSTLHWRGFLATACCTGNHCCYHFVIISLCSQRRLPWRTRNCVQHVPDKTFWLCLSLDRCGSDNTLRSADVYLLVSQPQYEIHTTDKLRFQLVRSASYSVQRMVEPPSHRTWVTLSGTVCHGRLSHDVLPSLPVSNNETIADARMVNHKITT